MSNANNDPYVIISADTHAELPTELYRPYIDPEFKDEFEDFLTQKEAEMRAGGMSDEEFAKQWFEQHGEGVSGGWDPVQRDKELDGDGICGEVIFPDADAVTIGKICLSIEFPHAFCPAS